MTDLEITKACAEAMGFNYGVGYRSFNMKTMEPVGPEQILVGSETYDPLHDDAQAMALVKKFQLWIGGWAFNGTVSCSQGGEFVSSANSLNRAICECVANMQKENP